VLRIYLPFSALPLLFDRRAFKLYYFEHVTQYTPYYMTIQSDIAVAYATCDAIKLSFLHYVTTVYHRLLEQLALVWK